MIVLTDQHKMMREYFRKYLEKEIEPLVEDLDEGRIAALDVVRKFVKTLGLGGGSGRKKSGDSDKKRAQAADTGTQALRDPYLQLISSVEISRVCPSLAMVLGANFGLAGPTIMAKGTPEQKERFGRPLFTFEKVACWAITEPEAGSDLFSMRTTAKRDGDNFILNGSKTFITNAPIADVFVIYAKTGEDPDTGKALISSFVMERGVKGLSTGEPFNKMGMRGSPTGEVFLDDVVLPAKDHLLGKEKTGRSQALDTLTDERSGIPGMAIGIMERCYETALKYAKERKQFGDYIANYQLIQDKLVWMYTTIQAAWGINIIMCETQKKGLPSVKETCAAKLYCSRMATQVALEAMQILGGYGYMKEYKLEMFMRDAKLLEIGGGTNEIQILNIARELLKE